MPRTAEERRLVAEAAAHESWAVPQDRSARTAAGAAKGQAALRQKFLDQAAGNEDRAEHLYKAHLARLRLKSLRARREAAEIRAKIEAAEAEEQLRELGELE